MHRLRQHLTATYLTLDARSLGLFRIVFGLVLLLNLFQRYQNVDLWYTNAGLVPTGYLLGHRYLVSLFFLASSHGEAVFGMVLCAVVFVAFTVGYRTRLFHVLTLICLVSLDGRTYFAGNSGDWVMNLLCVWTLFLPLGRRFSVDAVVGSLRRVVEKTPEEIGDRAAMAGDDRPVVSLAVLALLLQFAAIYFFSAFHKTGTDWFDGSAVHYALHLNRLLSSFGLWVRGLLPYPILQSLSWGTLVVEYAAVILLLSPLWVRQLRLAAVFLLPAMHLGFGLCLNIGVFSHVMISYFALLLAPQDWSRLGALGRRLTHRRVVFFDAGCGVCFQFCRLLARLDVWERLDFVSNRDKERLPEGITSEITERTIVVANATTGRVEQSAAAIASVIASLPAGYPVAMVLRIPGFAGLARWGYDLFSRHRVAISVWLGLQACGLPAAPAALTETLPEKRDGRPSARLWTDRWGARIREAAVLVVMIASFSDLAANADVPEWMRHERPALLHAITAYPRLHQHWWMFAPAPMRSDTTIAVEAITRDGRRVDPYNEAVGDHLVLAPDTLPPRLGYDRMSSRYALNLGTNGYAGYRPAFAQWILRYHERTGNPDDRIVGFRAYVVRKVSPAPDADPTAKPRVTRRVLLKHP